MNEQNQVPSEALVYSTEKAFRWVDPYSRFDPADQVKDKPNNYAVSRLTDMMEDLGLSPAEAASMAACDPDQWCLLVQRYDQGI